MRLLSMMAVVGAASALTACSTVPALDLAKTTVAHPDVATIIDHIACEMAVARDNNPTLKSGKYVATMVLTLQADENLGLTPSLSFITPYHAAGTSLSKALGLELSETKQHVFAETFSIELDKASSKAVSTDSATGKKICSETTSDGAVLLSGYLGLEEIMTQGVDSTSQPYILKYTADDSRAKFGPSFGSTVQFVLKRAANGGPVWTLVHFKGGAGSNGLGAYGRMDTSRLVFTMSPVAKESGKFAAYGTGQQQELVAEAIAGNESLLTTMVLQQITTTPR